VHQLSIDDDGAPTVVTEHRDFDTAQRALLDYLVRADYYLQPVHTSAARIHYRLLALADPPARAPGITGSATIAALPDTRLPRDDQREAQSGATRDPLGANAP
jgi:hypothetical protein